jgi:hypothetical protein
MPFPCRVNSNMPCRSPAVLVPWPWEVAFRTAWSCHCRGKAREWHGMCESNTAALCKTQSKPLAERLGRGTLWERHDVCELALILWTVALSSPFTPCIGRLLRPQHVYSPYRDKQLKQVEKTLSKGKTYGETSPHFFLNFSFKTHRRQMFMQLVAEREHLKWTFISRNIVVEFTL